MTFLSYSQWPTFKATGGIIKTLDYLRQLIFAVINTVEGVCFMNCRYPWQEYPLMFYLKANQIIV